MKVSHVLFILNLVIGISGCSAEEDALPITPSIPCPPLPSPVPLTSDTPVSTQPSHTSLVTPKGQHTPGLLVVHPQNPAYFQDTATGKAVFLHGFDHFRALQEVNNNHVSPLDFQAFITQLTRYHHNFLRLWMWEHFWRISEVNEIHPEGEPSHVRGPHIYQRTGPGNAIDGQLKFDLTKFDQRYFDRMRERIIMAGKSGIWVSVMLFQGWSLEGLGNFANTPWQGHPFNRHNNINGINGDVDQDGNGWEIHTRTHPQINALHEAYVKKVIDTIGDLESVLFEISNESVATEIPGRCHHVSRVQDWAFHQIALIRQYEDLKGVGPHPIGLSGFRPIPGDPPLEGNNLFLLSSPADYISPTGDPWSGKEEWKYDPPIATGEKVVIADSDHIQPGKHGGPGIRSWLWRTFTRGHNINTVDGDPHQGADWVSSGDSQTMRAMDRLVSKVNLAAMRPHPALSSTTYCLADPGQAYIVYQPLKPRKAHGEGEPFHLNLLGGDYRYEWFNPTTNEITHTGQITKATGTSTFKPPFYDHAVLFLLGANREGQ